MLDIPSWQLVFELRNIMFYMKSSYDLELLIISENIR